MLIEDLFVLHKHTQKLYTWREESIFVGISGLDE